jgi:hypothetical protein
MIRKVFRMQYKVWVGSWVLGCTATAWAQAPAIEATPPVAAVAVAVVAPDPVPALPWALAVNRRVQFSSALLKSHYREHDTAGLTPDGVLDTEQGHIRGNGLAVRWQGDTPWLPVARQGLWVEWSYQYLSGQTRYQGYLQKGNALTPYGAKTGNAYSTWQARLGVPLVGLPAPEQVQYGQQRWQRNLVQYSEIFRYHWWAAGLLAQWHPQQAALQNWTVELDASTGRHSHAHIQTPAMDFAASLPTKPIYRFGMSATYQWHPQWSVTGSWQLQRSHSGASAVVNGFQEPTSRSSQQQWQLALNLHF